MAEIQEDCRRLANVEPGKKKTPLGEKETPLGEKATKLAKANFVGKKKNYSSWANIEISGIDSRACCFLKVC